MTIDLSDRRKRGLRMRDATIEHFASSEFTSVLREILHSDSVAKSVALPSAVEVDAVLRDMRADEGWAEEGWRLGPDGRVDHVEASRLDALPEGERFSISDTLRRPRRDAYALRGLLSGLHSDVVSDAFSEVAGARVTYKSADIARYRPGHRLRRHDDVYDGRIFGLVFFVHDEWPAGAGTRLVAEKPDGRCIVVDPIPGTVAVMRLANGHFHQVEPNFSPSWHRYSLAVHFGVAI